MLDNNNINEQLENQDNQNNNNENNENNDNGNDNNNTIPVLNHDTSNPSSYINISRDFYHQKQYNKALLYIIIYLNCYPNSFQGLFLKCQIYLKQNISNKALVLLNKAYSLLKKNEDPDNLQEIKLLKLKGKCYMSLGRYDEAIATYEKLNTFEETARTYLKIGVCYYDKKKLEEAIKNYDKALKLNPNLTEALFNKGICLCNLDKKNEAIEIFNKALEINQNEPELYLQRGYCFFVLENYRKAIKDFNKAIELRPNFSEAYCRKGACYEALKREEDAVVEYTQAIELNDMHSAEILYQASYFLTNYYKNKNNLEKIGFYTIKCAQYGPANEGAQFNAGVVLMKKNNYVEAIKYFDNVLKINRTNTTAVYNKGICLFQLDQIEEAFKSFCIVLNINTKVKDVECLLYKGICQEKLKKYSEGIQIFDKIIKINNKYYKAYLHRGICYCCLKDFANAVSDFIIYDKNITKDKEMDFYYYRALCFINSNKIEDAINDLNKAIEINKDKANIHFKLGFCYLIRKNKENIKNNLELAIKEFDISIKLDNKNTEPYYNKAIALTNLNKKNEAIKEYDKLIELSPNDMESKYNQSLLLIQLSKYSEAEKKLKEIINYLNKYKSSFSKNLYSIYYNLGLCQNHMELWEEAKDNLSNSIQLNKNFADCYFERAKSY